MARREHGLRKAGDGNLAGLTEKLCPNKDLFSGIVRVDEENKIVYGPNKVMANLFIDKKDLHGYKVEVDENLKIREEGDSEIEVLSSSVNYSEKTLFDRCLPYSFIGSRSNFFRKDPNPIIHKGNEDVYDYFKQFIEENLYDENQEPATSIIIGNNGDGKTFALNAFSYMLREAGVPIVAFGLDKLNRDLTPKNHKKDETGEIIAPKYYSLANRAKVILIDQLQDTYRRNNKGLFNRPGVQRWTLDLLNHANERDASVFLFLTESPGFGLEELLYFLTNDHIKDKSGNAGLRDLGSRIASYDKIRLECVPEEEQQEFVRIMVNRNYIFKERGIPVDVIAEGLSASMYGEEFTPRLVSGRIKSIERLVRNGTEITPYNIVKKCGRKAAIENLKQERFAYAKEGDPDFEKMSLRELLNPKGYNAKDVHNAIMAHVNDEVKIGQEEMDREIIEIVEAADYLYEKGKENGYLVSEKSQEALKKLLDIWTERKHKQLSLI